MKNPIGYTCRRQLAELVRNHKRSNGVDHANGYNEFSVYPNPNSGSFFIENLGNSTAATVSITDVQGKEVYSTSFNTNNRINVDMNNLEKGMYMVTVKSENGVQIENVIVQ